MLESLFPELKEMIFMYLPCKYIISLSLCCTNLNKSIKNNNIINRRKYQGFPRLENHCKSHDISNLDTSSLVDFSWENFNEIPCSKTLDDILDLLLKLDIDLIRGDLIYNGLDESKFNRNCEGLCIFDGSNIIPLYDDEVDDQGLPSEFTVLNNNINLYYWEGRYDRNDNCLDRGIPNTSLVWLEITEDIRSQLINNISCDGASFFSEYEPYYGTTYGTIFYTKFYINNEYYYIVSQEPKSSYCVYGEYNKKEYCDVFVEILTLKSKVALRYNDTDELFSGSMEDVLILRYNDSNEPFSCLENVLFLDMYFNIKTKF